MSAMTMPLAQEEGSAPHGTVRVKPSAGHFTCVTSMDHRGQRESEDDDDVEGEEDAKYDNDDDIAIQNPWSNATQHNAWTRHTNVGNVTPTSATSTVTLQRTSRWIGSRCSVQSWAIVQFGVVRCSAEGTLGCAMGNSRTRTSSQNLLSKRTKKRY